MYDGSCEKNECAHPVLNKTFKNNSNNPKGSTFDFEINIKAILTSFYLGTGGLDIGSYASFFGLPGGRCWERSFHWHIPQAHNIIISLADAIPKEAMMYEINTTIKYKLEGKYTEAEIEKIIDGFIAGKYHDVPADILKIRIAVSYDMRWIKQSMRKVYDSLSGHIFIIGCRTGNVIGMKIKKIKCSIYR